MNYYNEIKENLIKCEIYEKTKDYLKDRNKVNVYFETGKLLSEAGKEYGKNIIKRFSEKLVIEVGKKYNERTLYRMRKFYEVFCNKKLSTTWSKLSWSHYRELMVLKNIDEIQYYAYITEQNNLSQRQLHDRIKTKEYDRLSKETKDKLIKQEKLKIYDLIPNPIIVSTKEVNAKINEYALKQIIINNLDDFLSQLGYGFAYIGNEFKIKIDGKYNYIDLLLFNYEYNCFVVIELKVTELQKDHIGQIQVYMNYIDECLKQFNQEETIGIIICKHNNKYVIKYCSDPRIMAKEYKLINI